MTSTSRWKLLRTVGVALNLLSRLCVAVLRQYAEQLVTDTKVESITSDYECRIVCSRGRSVESDTANLYFQNDDIPATKPPIAVRDSVRAILTAEIIAKR